MEINMSLKDAITIRELIRQMYLGCKPDAMNGSENFKDQLNRIESIFTETIPGEDRFPSWRKQPALF